MIGTLRPLLAVATLALVTSCTTTGPSNERPLDAEAWRGAKSKLYHRLAMQYLHTGDHERARNLLQQAVEFDGEDPQALELLTRLEYGNGNLVGAARAAHRLLEQMPKSVAAMCTLGSIAEAQGDVAAAEQRYKDALECAPNDPRPWTDLHRLYLDQGRADEAAEARRELVTRFPDSVDAWLDHGAFLASTGRWQEASDVYRQALTARPGNVEAAARFALSALVSDRPSEVLALSKLLAPHARLGNSTLAIATATARMADGNHEAALRELDLLDAVTAAHPRVRVLRGELLLRTGRMDAAREEFVAAVESDPTIARAHANLGRIHLQQARDHAAIRSLRSALQFDPDDGVSHALLAASLVDEDRNAALRHLGRARGLPGTESLVREVERLFPQLTAKPEDRR